MSGPKTYAVDTSGLGDRNEEREASGKFTNSRTERGRTHALSLLENPKYRAALEERMIAGTAGPVEVWIWRIGYGDPPRAKEDDSQDEERFARLRAGLRELLKEAPEVSRALIAQVAGAGRQAPQLPAPRRVVKADAVDPQPEDSKT